MTFAIGTIKLDHITVLAPLAGITNLPFRRIVKDIGCGLVCTEMVSADGEFDCELMRAGEGNIVCKRGAEGYQIIGLLPGVLGKDSPGVGIAFKVSDGDASRKDMNLESSVRVRPAVTVEILRQLGALSPKLGQALGRFGPVNPILNHRGILTGQSRPVFSF